MNIAWHDPRALAFAAAYSKAVPGKPVSMRIVRSLAEAVVRSDEIKRAAANGMATDADESAVADELERMSQYVSSLNLDPSVQARLLEMAGSLVNSAERDQRSKAASASASADARKRASARDKQAQDEKRRAEARNRLAADAATTRLDAALGGLRAPAWIASR
jgi:hypothetical protein